MPEAVFHRLDRDGVVARLRDYAERELAPRPEVREVVLIGSLARGDWSARSDADVVIVVDRTDEPSRHRAPRYAPRSAPPLPLDVFVYTPEEAAEWSRRFRREVEHGIVLHRRPATG